MNRNLRSAQDNASRRDELGGYTDAEFDAALARSQRSDAFSVGVRLLTLVVVFWLMARAIRAHAIPAWMLILPLVVEFVAVFCIGFVLSRFVIDCKAFAKSAGSAGLLLVWVLGIVGVMLGFAGMDPEADAWHWAHVDDGLVLGWQSVSAAGLHWVMAVSLIGLSISTTFEVLRWRRLRGVFVWTSIMHSGFRLGVMFLLGFAALFVVIFLGNFAASLSDWRGSSLAWPVYLFLLVSEVLTVVLTALMHRDALKKQRLPKTP